MSNVHKLAPSLDGVPEIRAFLGAPAEHDHIVQFYESDQALRQSVGHFIAAGLRAGEATIVIATQEHRTLITLELEILGVEVARAFTSGQLVLLDAQETLARFMVGDTPDWQKFRALIGGVLDTAIKAHPEKGVRAYGEMVDLLWRAGNRQGAIQLEEHWNDLGKEYAFSLLCAYTMENFTASNDGDGFQRVCGTHSHVIPAESIANIVDPDERARSISALQQRARALETEIAHRRELEVALRDALARERGLREDAERNVRFAEMFCGMLSHDLRNPLNTITMGANYIARTDLGEKNTRAATRIVTSAERMARMIDQLLDFTRIRTAGGLELDRVRVDISDVCARVKEELVAANPQCVIKLVTNGNTGGFWDYDRLLQVFSNLVGNAVTHGSAGCEVSVEADGAHSSDVVAYVRNGGAIDPEMMPVIFDPFRGGKKRHNTKGLGLGLYITRQIVLAHGGEIAVTSSDTSGTLVCVRLPRFPREVTEKVEV